MRWCKYSILRPALSVKYSSWQFFPVFPIDERLKPATKNSVTGINTLVPRNLLMPLQISTKFRLIDRKKISKEKNESWK